MVNEFTMKKIGVLLLNLGTPDDPSVGSLKKYLKQFLLDPRVIDIGTIARNILVRGIIVPTRAPKSAKSYKLLWTENGSPLKFYGLRVEKQLQEKLGDDFMVRIAMRYQSPSIPDVLKEFEKANLDKIVIFPMFPQYASASTGSALENAMNEISKWLVIPELHIVSSYHDNDSMLNIYADNAKKKGIENYDYFLFSFHGLPIRQILKSDCSNYCLNDASCCQSINDKNKNCYSAQCHDTSRRLASKLNIDSDQYQVVFQSRLGKDKWTEPFAPDVLKELAEEGIKKLLVFSPSFTADCLETSVEIADEYNEEFLKMGGHQLDLVESLNDDPKWVDTIYKMLQKHLH